MPVVGRGSAHKLAANPLRNGALAVINAVKSEISMTQLLKFAEDFGLVPCLLTRQNAIEVTLL